MEIPVWSTNRSRRLANRYAYLDTDMRRLPEPESLVIAGWAERRSLIWSQESVRVYLVWCA